MEKMLRKVSVEKIGLGKMHNAGAETVAPHCGLVEQRHPPTVSVLTSTHALVKRKGKSRYVKVRLLVLC